VKDDKDTPILLPLVRKPFPELDAKAICSADPYSQDLFRRLFGGARVEVRGDTAHPLTGILKIAMESTPEKEM